MLLDGLRSCEILSLQLEDLKLADALLHVLGKGNKQRTLPLPGEIMEVLQSYLRLERPLTNSPSLFVSLKGRRRGQPITPAGLRSLFRHHRLCSQVAAANPHCFRHTFGADMVRAGISLPLSSSSWDIPRFTPPCFMSNLLPRTSGVNMPAPLPTVLV